MGCGLASCLNVAQALDIVMISFRQHVVDGRHLAILVEFILETSQ